MINKEYLSGGIVGTILSGVGAGVSLEQIQQIISIICTCVGAIITIVSCIIIPLVRHIKKAKEDGKITKEEIQEGIEIVQNGINSVKDDLDK